MLTMETGSNIEKDEMGSLLPIAVGLRELLTNTNLYTERWVERTSDSLDMSVAVCSVCCL